MKILGLKSVLVGVVWSGVWAGLGMVAAGQGGTNPTRDDKLVTNGEPGAVAAKRPMTFADLMAMKRVSDPQISPSGKWVLFSVMDVSAGEEYEGEPSVGGGAGPHP